MHRQAVLPQSFGERFGDRLVVLDEQYVYAHGVFSLQRKGVRGFDTLQEKVSIRFPDPGVVK
jgi:hypothetical protein